MDGTICASGSICQLGSCNSTNLVQPDRCPFGDTFIYPSIIDFSLNSLNNRVSCAEAFNLILSLNRPIENYCNDSNFNIFCCQSCKS